MFRLRLPRRALLASSAAAALTAVPQAEKADKPSIYPPPERPLLLLDTPSPLELQIRKTRHSVEEAYEGVRESVQGVVGRWIAVEGRVESRIKSLRDPSEPLTPSALYIGISTLTGSILTRSRSLPTRFLLPPTLLVASTFYFLPKTASRIRAYTGELEERYVPRVAETHAVANAHARMTWERIREGTREGREGAGRGVRGGVRWVQEKTGLRIGDAMGWGPDEAVRDKVGQVKEVIEQRVGDIAKEAVEEVKRVV